MSKTTTPTLIARLRDTAGKLRTHPLTLANFIPMLQQAADRLEEQSKDAILLGWAVVCAGGPSQPDLTIATRYVARSEGAVRHMIEHGAMRDGYLGTVDELLATRGWTIAPLYGSEQPYTKDHEVAQLVNELTTIAKEHHADDSLRQRISAAVCSTFRRGANV